MLKIKQYRCQKKMSQSALAEKIGVTDSAISQYESGKRKPDIILLKKISKILDCSVDDLIRG